MNTKMIDTMLRNSVGLNPWFFERNDGNPKFPPHNITQIGEYRYRLTLAVAGFTQNELQITLKGEHLTVSGDKASVDDSENTDHKVLYRGIAYRNFSNEFLIGQHVDIEGATLKNGLLEIDLVRNIPEAEKLKQITISASS